MNPASFKIDSPNPQLASQEAQRYYEFLEPAFVLSGFDYDPEEFDQDLLSGDTLLIRIWNDAELQALAAVKVREVKGVRDLFVLGLVGEEAWRWAEEFSQVVDKLADEAKCRTISMLARPGMRQHVKQRGYRVHQCVFRKVLKGSNGDGR